MPSLHFHSRTWRGCLKCPSLFQYLPKKKMWTHGNLHMLCSLPPPWLIPLNFSFASLRNKGTRDKELQKQIRAPDLGQARRLPLERAVAPHSSTLAWRIPWTEEPDGLWSMGSLRVGHNWATSLSLFTFTHWRRKWQRTQCSCLESPRDGGTWWAAVYGVTQSRTRLKWLSSSSSSRFPQQDIQAEDLYTLFTLPPSAEKSTGRCCAEKGPIVTLVMKKQLPTLWEEKWPEGFRTLLGVAARCHPLHQHMAGSGIPIKPSWSHLPPLRSQFFLKSRLTGHLAAWHLLRFSGLLARSHLTLCNPVDYSPPGSSVHGIFQARILEWVAISFSRGSSWPRDWTCVSYISRVILHHWATREAISALQ